MEAKELVELLYQESDFTSMDKKLTRLETMLSALENGDQSNLNELLTLIKKINAANSLNEIFDSQDNLLTRLAAIVQTCLDYS